jgi:hypothetical protein
MPTAGRLSAATAGIGAADRDSTATRLRLRSADDRRSGIRIETCNGFATLDGNSMKGSIVLRAGAFLLAISLAGAAVVSPLAAAQAGSLAGSEGQVKRKHVFDNLEYGPCKNGYRQYVAASGHSAYASSPSGFGNEVYVCSWRLNFATKAKAEAAAMADCKAGVKKWKDEVFGPCEIIASK